MDKQQKRAQREREICQQATTLLQEQGFLGVRMSDVAKVSGYSMGTIYSHFSSKEDLLVACAVEVEEEILNTLRRALEQPLPPLERLLLMGLVAWSCVEQNPTADELVHLSMSPSIWRRASPARHAQQVKLSNDFAQQVYIQLEQACADGSLLSSPGCKNCSLQDWVRLMESALWGLFIGFRQVCESGQRSFLTEQKRLTAVYACWISLLRGFGWQDQNPEVLIERLQPLAAKILQ